MRAAEGKPRSFCYDPYLMPHRVSRFLTCILIGYFPQVGIAVADVLEGAGCDVDFATPKPAVGSRSMCSRMPNTSLYRYFLKIRISPPE